MTDPATSADTTTEDTSQPAAPHGRQSTDLAHVERGVRQGHDVPERWQDQVELARFMAGNGVLPEHMQTPAALLVSQRAAVAYDIPSFLVQTTMHLVEGKVAFDASLLRALVRRAGHKIKTTERTKERAEVTIWRCDEPGEPYVYEFTVEDALDAELVTRDKTGKITSHRPNWRRYLKAMLVARATTIAVREVCPEVIFGPGYTPEEIGAQYVEDEDGQIVYHPSVRADGEPSAAGDGDAQQQPARVTEVTEEDPKAALRAHWRARIQACRTVADVDALHAEAAQRGHLGGQLTPDMTVAGALAARRTQITDADPACQADEDDGEGADGEGADGEGVYDADVIHDTASQPAQDDEEGGSPPERGPRVIDAELPDDGWGSPPAAASHRDDDDVPATGLSAHPPGFGVPDHPDLCKGGGRAGYLNNLRRGGDPEALVQAVFGLPLSQVGNRRLRALVIDQAKHQ